MKRLIFRFVIITLSALCLMPLLITVCGSFLSPEEMGKTARILPRNPTLFQYEQVLLHTPQYLLWFWNSVKIAVFTIVLAIPLSLTAAFGFAKFHFPGKDAVFFVYIIVMLMPFQATLVPQYISLQSLNLLDTTAAVVLPGAFSAFGAFLLTQFMKGIDNEVLDAARVDGLSEFRVFVYVVVPLSKTAISALFVLLFIECFAMIEPPLIFLNDPAKWPLSLSLGNASSLLYAGGAVFLVLPLLLYLFAYDDLVEGIGHSGIK